MSNLEVCDNCHQEICLNNCPECGIHIIDVEGLVEYIDVLKARIKELEGECLS